MSYEVSDHVRAVVARLNEKPLSDLDRANMSAALQACVAPKPYVEPYPALEERLASNPEKYVRKCWVYRYFDAENTLLYVGQTIDLGKRNTYHKAKAPWYGKVSRRTEVEYPNEQAAQHAEAVAIRDEAPLFNQVRPRTDRWGY